MKKLVVITAYGSLDCMKTYVQHTTLKDHKHLLIYGGDIKEEDVAKLPSFISYVSLNYVIEKLGLANHQCRKDPMLMNKVNVMYVLQELSHAYDEFLFIDDDLIWLDGWEDMEDNIYVSHKNSLTGDLDLKEYFPNYDKANKINAGAMYVKKEFKPFLDVSFRSYLRLVSDLVDLPRTKTKVRVSDEYMYTDAIGLALSWKKPVKLANLYTISTPGTRPTKIKRNHHYIGLDKETFIANLKNGDIEICSK